MQRDAILPVLCRRDNYAYLIGDSKGSDCWVVDPTEALPIQRLIEKRGQTLRGILATHHHHDHVGGIEALVAWQSAQGERPFVAGHAHDKGRIPCQDHFVQAPTQRYIDSGLVVADLPVLAAHIPGHTLGAIAWKIGEHVFTGDTLFSGGCGRLFEGTPQQMYDSLRTILNGPEHTLLWFGHEYTRQNLSFAVRTQPEHEPYQSALDTLHEPSCPSSIGREKQINIFARATDAQALGELRALKDRS